MPKNHRVAAAKQAELTEREVEVVELLCKGYSNKIIADELGVSPHTVKFHIIGLTRKLNGPKNGSRVLAAVRWTLKCTHDQLNVRRSTEDLSAPGAPA